MTVLSARYFHREHPGSLPAGKIGSHGKDAFEDGLNRLSWQLLISDGRLFFIEIADE
jgi:hypothetical protein